MLIEISLASGVCTHMYSKIVSSFINVFWVVCFGWFYIILSPNDKCKPKASKIKRYRTHNGHIQCIECTTCANYIGFNTYRKAICTWIYFLFYWMRIRFKSFEKENQSIGTGIHPFSLHTITTLCIRYTAYCIDLSYDKILMAIWYVYHIECDRYYYYGLLLLLLQC